MFLMKRRATNWAGQFGLVESGRLAVQNKIIAEMTNWSLKICMTLYSKPWGRVGEQTRGGAGVRLEMRPTLRLEPIAIHTSLLYTDNGPSVYAFISLLCFIVVFIFNQFGRFNFLFAALSWLWYSDSPFLILYFFFPTFLVYSNFKEFRWEKKRKRWGIFNCDKIPAICKDKVFLFLNLCCNILYY